MISTEGSLSLFVFLALVSDVRLHKSHSGFLSHCQQERNNKLDIRLFSSPLRE